MAVSDCVRSCRQCGAEFKRTGKGQPTKYCSAHCRSLRLGPKRSLKGPDHTCPICSISFRPKCGKAASRFCSHGCAQVARHRQFPPARKYATREARCRAAYERRRARPCGALGLIKVACCGCGITDARKKGRSGDPARYCSAECYQNARTRVASEALILRGWALSYRRSTEYSPEVKAEVAALQRIARYVERTKLIRVTCARCSALLIRPRLGGARASCASCAKDSRKKYQKVHRRTPAARAARLKLKTIRRARLKAFAEAIDPIEIFDRDGWSCRWCEQETPRGRRGSYEPNAPELDHIVPLARGGSHTWDNVCCSCRRCNGLKRDKDPLQFDPTNLNVEPFSFRFHGGA